jgi:hypothetical protein
MDIFNICALDKQALLPATVLATELSPSAALSTTNLKANPYTSIMDTFMFDPNNTKSLYWRTFFIVIRHFFVYYVLLIIFSALIFLFINHLCDWGLQDESKASLKKIILFIIVGVLMLSLKIFIDKSGDWFGAFLLQFCLIVTIMIIGLIGDRLTPPDPLNSIFLIFVFFICMLIFNLIFASFDWYKRLWDVDTNDTSKAITS